MRNALRTTSVAVAAAFLLAGCGEQSSESITGPGIQASHNLGSEPGLSVRDISGIAASDFTTAGTGTHSNDPASFTFDVPAGASVEAVYLYWARRLEDPGAHPPAEISVNGTTVTADDTFGPVSTSDDGLTPIGYRADVTGESFVSAGSNTLTVEDDVSRALGASVLVFYDTGDTPSELSLYDGVDFAWEEATITELQSATPVTFSVSSASVSRSATLRLLVGDVEPDDTNDKTELDVTIGGTTTTYDNPFTGEEGPAWDDYSLGITIPAGVTEVTVEPISPDPDGESLQWTMAGLSVHSPGGEGCTPGYWRQEHHFDSWHSDYDPDALFTSVFDGGFDFVRPEHNTDLATLTLSAALELRGGDVNALTRHAVAALLNAASDDVSYDLTVQEVIDRFNAAVDGGDIEGTKDEFEGFNEQGCPLN